MISVLGIYTTNFGELWHTSLRDLISEAAEGAIKDAGIKRNKIEALYLGNMLSGMLSGQEQLGPILAEQLGLNVSAIRIEGACASGGLAVFEAVNSLDSGRFENVLVVGAEKMTDRTQDVVSMALMAAGSDAERQAGATFPGLYAILARNHMEKFHTTEEQMASVSVKNHFHASLNGQAHFRTTITIDQVLRSAIIADPLKLLDCSPISDGAAAVVLSSKKTGLKRKKVFLSASEVATDTIGLAQRESLDELKATRIAGTKAFKKAVVTPKEIDIAELHDCFTIAEILALEDLGFFKKGEAGEKILSGETKLGAHGLVTNTSGGLKACGHPVGATGVKQIVEVVRQLRGEAKKKQVENAKVGLCQNVGGSGATAVVTILKT